MFVDLSKSGEGVSGKGVKKWWWWLKDSNGKLSSLLLSLSLSLKSLVFFNPSFKTVCLAFLGQELNLSFIFCFSVVSSCKSVDKHNVRPFSNFFSPHFVSGHPLFSYSLIYVPTELPRYKQSI